MHDKRRTHTDIIRHHTNIVGKHDDNPLAAFSGIRFSKCFSDTNKLNKPFGIPEFWAQPSQCRNRSDLLAAPLLPFAGASALRGKSNLQGKDAGSHPNPRKSWHVPPFQKQYLNSDKQGFLDGQSWYSILLDITSSFYLWLLYLFYLCLIQHNIYIRYTIINMGYSIIILSMLIFFGGLLTPQRLGHTWPGFRFSFGASPSPAQRSCGEIEKIASPGALQGYINKFAWLKKCSLIYIYRYIYIYMYI